MKEPVRVAVTGAAGQIGYSLVFRIASGDLLGEDQPVILSLLEITPALPALNGVVMELLDCACPLLAGVVVTDDAHAAFHAVNYAMLVGSRPRTKGMERKELLEANGAIFTAQGKALAGAAADDVRVLVVGNPANTNCLIAMNNAKSIAPQRFTAMTRLDHNRAKAQLAAKVDRPVESVTRMTIWGNHSATQYPDVFHAEVDGEPAANLVDQAWIENDFIPGVQQRGAAVIEARGSSSAASAANAALDHVRDWALGTPAGDWVSMAVPSDGSYDVPEGLISGFPCTTMDGDWSIVPGLELNDFSRARIDASVAELLEERDAVKELGLILCPGCSFGVVRMWRQPSPFGEVTVVASPSGVREISLPGDDQPDGKVGAAEPLVKRQLGEWFAGKRHEFDFTIDLDGVEGFRRTVLETLARDVAWGEIVTYGELAGMAGRPRAARAVGSAMRDNPLPFVIPCHRVVAAGGRIGGYGGGRNAVALKRELLEREGVTGLR